MRWLIYPVGFWITAMVMRRLGVGFKENPQPIPLGGFAVHDVTWSGWVLMALWPFTLLILGGFWLIGRPEKR